MDIQQGQGECMLHGDHLLCYGLNPAVLGTEPGKFLLIARLVAQLLEEHRPSFGERLSPPLRS